MVIKKIDYEPDQRYLKFFVFRLVITLWIHLKTYFDSEARVVHY